MICGINIKEVPIHYQVSEFFRLEMFWSQENKFYIWVYYVYQHSEVKPEGPILLSESHTCFFLSQIQAHTCIFSRFIFPHLFSELIYVPLPPLYPVPHPVFLVLIIINFWINICFVLIIATFTHPSPYIIYLLKMTWKPLNRRRTYLCSTSSREFEECLNKAGNHTWRKRRQNENRKPVLWNRIRLLLFDKCKFTKLSQRTKSWTRQTIHWVHINQI